MKTGCRVEVVDSQKLKTMKLEGLLGMKGVVTEDLSFKERRNKGYMVHFDETYNNEQVWFVPLDSVKFDE